MLGFISLKLWIQNYQSWSKTITVKPRKLTMRSFQHILLTFTTFNTNFVVLKTNLRIKYPLFTRMFQFRLMVSFNKVTSLFSHLVAPKNSNLANVVIWEATWGHVTSMDELISRRKLWKLSSRFSWLQRRWTWGFQLLETFSQWTKKYSSQNYFWVWLIKALYLNASFVAVLHYSQVFHLVLPSPLIFWAFLSIYFTSCHNLTSKSPHLPGYPQFGACWSDTAASMTQT